MPLPVLSDTPALALPLPCAHGRFVCSESAVLVLAAGVATRRRRRGQHGVGRLRGSSLAAQAAVAPAACNSPLYRSRVVLANAEACKAAANVDLQLEALADALLAGGATTVDCRWCGSTEALRGFGIYVPDEDAATMEEARALMCHPRHSPAMAESAKMLFWGSVVLDVLWHSSDAALTAVTATSKVLLHLEAGLALQEVPVSDTEWMAAVRDQCRPEVLGQVAVAHTLSPPAEVEELLSKHHPRPPLLTLEVGSAFGFGDHATTRLCGEWLFRDRSRVEGATVLDYGCGTGVLALGALLLGASSASGVDCDLASLMLACSNSKLNDLPLQLYVGSDAEQGDWPCVSFYSPTVGSRGEAPFPMGPPEGCRFDVVVANMTSGPVMRLAPRLVRALAAKGRLALSGIRADMAAAVCDKYAAEGVNLAVGASKDEWVLLVNEE